MKMDLAIFLISNYSLMWFIHSKQNMKTNILAFLHVKWGLTCLLLNAMLMLVVQWGSPFSVCEEIQNNYTSRGGMKNSLSFLSPFYLNHCTFPMKYLLNLIHGAWIWVLVKRVFWKWILFCHLRNMREWDLLVVLWKEPYGHTAKKWYFTIWWQLLSIGVFKEKTVRLSRSLSSLY